MLEASAEFLGRIHRFCLIVPKKARDGRRGIELYRVSQCQQRLVEVGGFLSRKGSKKKMVGERYDIRRGSNLLL